MLTINSVERLESSYKNCPLVANMMVYADSLHNDLLALVFPNKPALEEWADKNGIVCRNSMHYSEGLLGPFLGEVVC